MASPSWERIGAATGIGSVALILAGFFSSPDMPDEHDSPQTFVSFFLDSGHRNRTLVSSVLVGVGLLLLLWFLGSLRTALRRPEGEPGRLSGVAFGAGLVFAGVLLVANATLLAVPAAIDFFDRIQLDGNTIMLMQGLGFMIFSTSGLAAAAMIMAASLLAMRVGAFPKWFGWVGFLLALGSLATFIFVGIFAVLLWLLIASIILTARAGATSGVPGV
jgi:hypothetical protein